MNAFHFGAGAERILHMLEKETEGNYLFLGKSGLKKTAFAREQIRKNLQIKNLEYCPDYYEVSEDGASIGVDDVADILSFTKTMAVIGDKKYCLIPYAQRLTPAASNALLKTIEESKNVIFVFTSNKKLMDTVMSRVGVIHCNPLTESEFYEEYPDADEAVGRFACGRSGAYEKIMSDKKLQTAARKLVCGVDGMEDSREFLEIFSLVKEKDPNSFFEFGPEFVSLSLEYLSDEILLHMLGVKKRFPYDTDECRKLLAEIAEARCRIELGKYGKNDFFALARKLVG